MILIIDHFDSFVHTLARYVREAGRRAQIVRQNEIALDAIRAAPPAALILSPGPGRPENSGGSLPLLRALKGRVPVLGVCLGHQIIAAAYGATLQAAPQPTHGMASDIRHNGDDIFAGLPNPMSVGRYHSLTVTDPPASLQVTARLDAPDAQIMGLHHRAHAMRGVQFHPESILTPHGRRLIENFLQ